MEKSNWESAKVKEERRKKEEREKRKEKREKRKEKRKEEGRSKPSNPNPKNQIEPKQNGLSTMQSSRKVFKIWSQGHGVFQEDFGAISESENNHQKSQGNEGEYNAKGN